ncbi:hypothetical protein CPT_Muldoon_252 [Serratia phage Muldoon]|uniref:Uncharacterized protein n=1 Tax=Serratia phage Muldoon TaxID=2601678 RepID=A0A5P8PHM4_9CAUD|nr:hypothetical protein HYP94_gp138 [Serratia phage Muldoon]QFR56203.1 hypothetical protein CPT_Muldoon_252 [Serratia phage Muldoon]
MVTSELELITALNDQLIQRGTGNAAEYDVWYDGHYLGTIIRVGLTYAEYKEDQRFKYHGHELCLQAALLRFTTRALHCIGLPINVELRDQGDILEFTYYMLDRLMRGIKWN